MTKTRTEAPGFDAADARAAAVTWRRRQHERVCDHVEAWRHGRLVRATAVSAYWDFNSVVVEDDAEDLSVEELARVAEDHSAGLAHRQIQVLSDRAGERLRLGLQTRGYHHQPLVTMALAGPAPEPDPGVRVRTAPDDAATPLRAGWYATEPWVSGDAVLREFLDAERAVHERMGGHVLLLDGDGPGGLAAYVRVCADGDTGEIEEAYVVPAIRGRGIGAALVASGARDLAATPGVRHVLIVADARGRPRRLYARLGFRPVLVAHVFTRLPGT